MLHFGGGGSSSKKVAERETDRVEIKSRGSKGDQAKKGALLVGTKNARRGDG